MMTRSVRDVTDHDSPGEAPVTAGRRPVHSSNRLGVDYAVEAEHLGEPVVPIIDVHSHIGGGAVTAVYAEAARCFGVERVYTMTQLEEVDAVRAVLGDRVRFIAVPDWKTEDDDRAWRLGRGYIERIEAFHRAGARIVKFWAAPRAVDYASELGDLDMFRLDAPVRIETMEAASALGMVFMTHVADPNTWFDAKYRDSARYGTKAQQYEPLEMLMERFTQPWIAAHMGGWPEDLEFLSGLLDRHANLYLDASATKWMVRELSRHARDDLVRFMTRYAGRVMFGSDIVASAEHLEAAADDEWAAKAGSREEAFDLYASRYWALRTLYETSFAGESPIADPDLAMVDPDRFGAMDAPMLRGKALPPEVLRPLYRETAEALLEPLCG